MYSYLVEGGVAPELLTGVVEVQGAGGSFLHQQGLKLQAAHNTTHINTQGRKEE